MINWKESDLFEWLKEIFKKDVING